MGIDNRTFKLPWARTTKPAMMIMMRASTFAKVEMTCRMAPHFTFIQFTKVSRAAKTEGKNQQNVNYQSPNNKKLCLHGNIFQAMSMKDESPHELM